MATDDCEHVARLCATLPPQRIRMELGPEAALAAVRHDYGLDQHEPVCGSERIRSSMRQQ